MTESGIYKIENLINGKIYIGSAINIRRRKYVHLYELRKNKHHAYYLQQSYNKYGEKNFRFQTICYCTPKELIRYEQFFIDTLKPEYNISKIAGSMLGFRHSRESIKKMSESKIGKKFTENHKLKISKSHLGKIVSKETRTRQSISKLGNTYCMGRTLSKETKNKIADSKRGKFNTKTSEPILQLDLDGNLIKEWPSMAEAHRNGFEQTCISACCRGVRKTHKGFRWKYKNKK